MMRCVVVCVDGEHKGRLWPVTNTPLIMGRASECAITLRDQTVSRRHCQILLEGDRVAFEDLGSRNLALINGRAKRRATLDPGDDVMLGNCLFLLADAQECAPVGDAPQDILPQALVWTLDSAGSDSKSGDVTGARPRTVQDLASLYTALAECAACADSDALFDTMTRRLIRYFNPEALWVTRVVGPGKWSLWRETDATPPLNALPEPIEALEKCLLLKRASMDSLHFSGNNGGERLLFVVPVLFDGEALAVIATRRRASDEFHAQGALQFLTLLAQAIAPVLFNIDRCANLRRDNERLRHGAGEPQLTLVGDSPVMQALRRQIRHAAGTDSHALVTGEAGVGKNIITRLLHVQSRRREAPLVTVNCASIPGDVFGERVFGDNGDVSQDAADTGDGLLQQARGGMVFLDDVADLDLENQTRILRFLETDAHRRPDPSGSVRADVRIIAATNKDLMVEVRQGRFLEELFHRLSGIHIIVPPLREHPEDIPALATHFLALFGHEARLPLHGFTSAAVDALLARPWPGNVRQLRQVVHRAVVLAKGGLLDEADLFGTVPDRPGSAMDDTVSGVATGAIMSLEAIEQQHINRALAVCGGNVRQAAQALGISRSALYGKINQR